MGTITLTINSAAIPSSPVVRTITFNDADLPDMISAFKAKMNNPAAGASDVATYYAQWIAQQTMSTTQTWRVAGANPVTPPAPPMTVS